jgi:GTP pyrophosphokinase
MKKVLEAIEFAFLKHLGQERPGGEPQFAHVLRVAKLAEECAQWLSPESGEVLVVSEILHDVLEDTPTTDAEICKKFGDEVAKIVRALSHESEEEPDEVYLRRVARGGKIAVLAKRFDRLDNLRSLATMPAEFRERKLAEVRSALPIWREIDPDGALEIEKGVESYG